MNSKKDNNSLVNFIYNGDINNKWEVRMSDSDYNWATSFAQNSLNQRQNSNFLTIKANQAIFSENSLSLNNKFERADKYNNFLKEDEKSMIDQISKEIIKKVRK